MRLVFLGSDAIALPALEFLRTASDVQLMGIITQPDRPAGRGRHLHANAVAQWARTQEVPMLQPLQPGAADLAWLREQRVDVALVMAYGDVYKRQAPRRWRAGADPVRRAGPAG